MIDNDVLRLDISMHDSLAMCIVETFQYLIDVVLAVARSQHLQQFAIISSRNMLHHQTVDLSFSHYVQQFYAVVTTSQSHQDLYLPIDLPKFYLNGSLFTWL